MMNFRLSRAPLRWFRVINKVGLMLQGMANFFRHFDRTKQWAWTYMVVAREK